MIKKEGKDELRESRKFGKTPKLRVTIIFQK